MSLIHSIIQNISDGNSSLSTWCSLHINAQVEEQAWNIISTFIDERGEQFESFVLSEAKYPNEDGDYIQTRLINGVEYFVDYDGWAGEDTYRHVMGFDTEGQHWYLQFANMGVDPWETHYRGWYSIADVNDMPYMEETHEAVHEMLNFIAREMLER